jgi:hypothetical protein
MKTYIKNQKGWLEALENVYSMTQSIPSNDKLYQNYSQERLNTDEWVALSIFDGGFSSVAHRSIWNNNCRILNRFFKLPAYRFENSKREVSKETIMMIHQQVKVAETLGFDCAFMSRERKTQAFNHYKKFLPFKWNVSNKKYRMIENMYQHIMWTAINNTVLNMEFENG